VKFEVRVTGRACADVAGAAAWIAQDSVDGALSWLDRYDEICRSLSRMPRRFARAPEAAGFGIELRQVTCGTYRVIYTIIERTVFVITVRHSARRPVTAADVDLDVGL